MYDLQLAALMGGLCPCARRSLPFASHGVCKVVAFPTFRFFFFSNYPAWPDQCLSRRPQKNSSLHLPQNHPLKEWHHLYLNNNNKNKNHRHFKSLISRTRKSPLLGDHGRNNNNRRTFQQVKNIHRGLDQLTLHKDHTFLLLLLLRHRYRMTVPPDLISSHTKVHHTSYRSTPQTETTIKMTIAMTRTLLQGQTL